MPDACFIANARAPSISCHGPLRQETGLPVLARTGQKDVEQTSHIHGEQNDGTSLSPQTPASGRRPQLVKSSFKQPDHLKSL